LWGIRPSELRTSSLVKHSSKGLHLLLDHLLRRLTANERIGMAESIPEIVYLLGSLADERRGTGRRVSVLDTFAEFLLWGIRSIHGRVHRKNRTMPQRGHPPHHSITSSARARIVEGISIPRDFAVLRLTANSTLTDC
jgi:hypothetical protein